MNINHKKINNYIQNKESPTDHLSLSQLLLLREFGITYRYLKVVDYLKSVDKQ